MVHTLQARRKQNLIGPAMHDWASLLKENFYALRSLLRPFSPYSALSVALGRLDSDSIGDVTSPRALNIWSGSNIAY